MNMDVDVTIIKYYEFFLTLRKRPLALKELKQSGVTSAGFFFVWNSFVVLLVFVDNNYSMLLWSDLCRYVVLRGW